jgi:conjugal transfer/entry exclusion protein
MMVMRKTLVTMAALAGCVAFGGAAHAQYPVFDGSNFGQAVQAVATAARELSQLQAQLQQMRQQYQMFTNPTNITGMFPALNAPALQNPMPAASAVPGQIAGAANTISGLGQTFYNLNHVFTATGTDPQASLLNRSAIATANIQGIAASNLASIEQRQANLNAMQTELQNATDIKQVEAINGRIAIESNAIQGQQAQAQNLTALASAQAQANQQAALQSIRQGHEQAAAMFTGTLN